MPSLSTMNLPDPRTFADGRVWLACWCADQPHRSTMEKVAELALHAGCSKAHMHRVIARDRHLSPAHAAALVPTFELPEAQAHHLLESLILPSLPPALAKKRREALLRSMAQAQGVPWGSSSQLILDRLPEPALMAALAEALAAYEDDLPSLSRLLDAAVPPMTVDTVAESLARPSVADRLAPRLLALRPPQGDAPPWALQGVFGFAAEALTRLSAAERDFRFLVASVDERAVAELDELHRDLEATLTRLADDVALRVPDRLMVLAVQRFTAAGPFLAGASQGMGWRPSAPPLPLLEEPLVEFEVPAPAATSASGAHPPSPVGLIWFPTWLKIWRAWRQSQGLPCSDAWLAKKVGLSRSLVYDLSLGSVRFSSDHVWRFAGAMGLDKAGQLALEGMAMAVAPSDVRTQLKTIHGLRALGIHSGNRNAAVEAYFVAAKWYAWVIRNLPDLPGFQPVAGWITRALKGRLEWRACQEALDALAAVGVLRREPGGRTVVLEPMVEVSGPHAGVASHELHLELLSQYQAELDMHDADLVPQAYLIALPEKAVEPLRQIIAAFDLRVYEVLLAAQQRHEAGQPLTRAMILTRQYFPVFRARPKPRPRPKKPRDPTPNPP